MITIKQASQQTGLSEPTLRYYEKEGIILPQRSEGGYRIYSPDDILWLKYVVVMKYAKFNLQDIQVIANLMKKEPTSECSEEVNRIFSKRIKEIKQVIETHMKMIELFDHLTSIKSEEEASKNTKQMNEFIEHIYDKIDEENKG